MRYWNAVTVIWSILACLLILLFASVSHASVINIEKLADAIYKAENSKSNPYGIMTRYKHTTPRQACINTIKHQLQTWKGSVDFIDYLGRTYAPIGASNDPTGLNKNWIRNVKYFYKRE